MPIHTHLVKTPDSFEEWLVTSEGQEALALVQHPNALKMAWNAAVELAAEVAEANEGVDLGIRMYKEPLLK